MEYLTHLAILFAIYAILALSLNLIMGYTGLLSLAHAAFYGIGAYTTAILTTVYDFNFFLSVLIGIGFSMFVSVLIGLVLSKFRGDYYALGSLGFNVIVFVGQSLFVHCQSDKQIQEQLGKRNIRVSIREIGYLGKKFIMYLALAHRESQEKIKQLMISKGGYILHLDSTVEGDSPHLMTAVDEIANIVLDNIKLPSEKADHIVPFLTRIKEAFGKPVAVTSDMGQGIASAVAKVFPGIPEFICHYHFLRDIGKDLFGGDYDMLRRGFKRFAVRTSLNTLTRQLQRRIERHPALTQNLSSYLNNNSEGVPL